MKVLFVIRKQAKRYDYKSRSNIYLRFQDGRKYYSQVRIGLSANSNFWDNENGCMKKHSACAPEEVEATNKVLLELKSFVELQYVRQNSVEKDWLSIQIDKFFHPENYAEPVPEKDTFDLMCEKYLSYQGLSLSRQKHFKVLREVLLRYQKYMSIKTKNDNYKLYAEDVTSETLLDMKDYIRNEYMYVVKYPELMDVTPGAKQVQVRSENTILDYLSRLRAFFLWSYKFKLITNRPFDQFKIEECIYGTPIILTQEERDHLAQFDLSHRPLLEVQRDIFIFQCLVGCRVGDLYSLTSENVIGGTIQYIQKKTKHDNPKTVTVPLVEEAKQLIKKYEGRSDKLFPYITPQKYNNDLKIIFKLAGLDRVVTVLNPQGRVPENKPLYELASSHLARRTFIGIMYKNCPNKSIIASMSGHDENSRAFSRYKKIDEDMQRQFMEQYLVKR